MKRTEGEAHISLRRINRGQQAPPGRTPFRTIITMIVVAESSRFCLPEETDFWLFFFLIYFFHIYFLPKHAGSNVKFFNCLWL